MCNNNQNLTLEQKAATALREAAKGYVIHYGGKDYKVEWLNATLQKDINEENFEMPFCGDAEVSLKEKYGTSTHIAQITGKVSIRNYEYQEIIYISIKSFR